MMKRLIGLLLVLCIGLGSVHILAEEEQSIPETWQIVYDWHDNTSLFWAEIDGETCTIKAVANYQNDELFVPYKENLCVKEHPLYNFGDPITVDTFFIDKDALKKGAEQVATITFAEGYEILPDGLCEGMYNLTTVNLPESVYAIGNDCFKDCTELENINLECVQYIGTDAFLGTEIDTESAKENESGEEYYIDVELKYYTSDRLSPIFLPMKTNCPEITFEIYYPDGTLYNKHTYPGNFFENGLYSDYCSYYHYDGDYLLVFSYEDCRTEIVFTIENSDRYKAWYERVYGFKPEEKEPESTEKPNTGNNNVSVGTIELNGSKVELYIGDVKEISVTSAKTVTVEVEDESIVEATLSNGILSIKALKEGTSEIWLRTSETYVAVSVTVLYGENPEKKGLYSDIEKDADCAEAVKELSELGIMQGYEDGTFKPEGTLTRAEAAAIMVRLLNLEEEVEKGETEFSDMPESHWASGYVNKAVENGIIIGMGDGTFKPEEKVTYHQLVKMLVCALGYEGMAVYNGGWNNGGYIFVAEKIGLIEHEPENNDKPITRGETAQLVYKSLEIELMDQSCDGGKQYGEFYQLVGKTILTEYWGIE